MPHTDKLILGTVQLGMAYGVNNQAGKPSHEEAFEILETARKHSIHTVDTASGYGESESLIGEFHKRGHRFKVITKFAVGDTFDPEKEWERASVILGVTELECWMYHRFEETSVEGIKDSLIRLKDKGKVKKIGVSIYSNEQLEQASKMEWVDVIQVPFNLLDNAHLRGKLMQQAKEKGKEIHTRSVFLQGLFFMEPGSFPEKLKPLAPYVALLKAKASSAQCSVGAMAIQYAIQNPFIDKILIGVEKKSQLEENIKLLSEKIDESIWAAIDAIQVKEVNLLSPVNW